MLKINHPPKATMWPVIYNKSYIKYQNTSIMLNLSKTRYSLRYGDGSERFVTELQAPLGYSLPITFKCCRCLLIRQISKSWSRRFGKNQEITDIRGYREKQSDSVIAEICIGSMAQELASAITTRDRFYHVDCRQLKNICSSLICRIAA